MTLLRYDDLFIKFNNLVDDRLCLVLTVEEQRIVGAPLDGPAVQPGVVVADAPQGDAANLRTVLVIDLEEVEPALVEFLLLVLRQSVDVGVVLLLQFEVLGDVGTAEPLGIGKHVDVELGVISTFTPQAAKASILFSYSSRLG